MLDEKELSELRAAVALLENPSFGVKVADFIGTPIERAVALLPASATAVIGSATRKAIQGALKLSLKTLDHHDPKSGAETPAASNWWHAAATATTGAVGGAFGLLALTIELPVSTAIMMRSMADVARSEGADLQDIEVQLECVQVLAFGGGSSSDDGAEVGYFVAREAMSKAVSKAAAHIGRNGLEKETAPAIVRLISLIAKRYSINVTEKPQPSSSRSSARLAVRSSIRYSSTISRTWRAATFVFVDWRSNMVRKSFAKNIWS
jgi:hypothetical protein